jgi:hypothetical protein
MNKTFRVALLLGLASLGATSIEAASPEGPPAEGIYVVNNYQATVRVYAEDSEGRLHRLGRVHQGQLEQFEIPAHLVGQAFRVKIYPSQPVWSLQVDDYGVKTNPLNLDGLSLVTIWVEPDLSKSMVQMDRG